MDCCGHEGVAVGDARFDVKAVAGGVHAVVAPAGHDLVAAVRCDAATGASLDEVKERVTAPLAPTYERAFATYHHYRPWRAGVLLNIECTLALVS